MARLQASGLDRLIPQLQRPLLGICLGLQLLFEHSAEGDTRCLGILAGRIERLQPAPGRPVPHMGWNTLELGRPDALFSGIASGERVYFVHSYAAGVGECSIAAVSYGRALAAAVRRGNFYGVQFHPERSAAVGSQLLRNFLSL
jgi:glutamine amidotransferase